CGGTAFAGVDLSETKGLEYVHHYGPSTIGTDTLIHSKGKIAEVFLYGCGLPDTWISRLPSLIAELQPFQFYSCFISYSTQDPASGSGLDADLRREGVRCWFDQEDMKIGEVIRDNIYYNINKHDKLMLVLSSHSIGSVWVEAEVEAALERERK